MESRSSARAAALHVRRAKNGKPSAHPLRDDEVRALRELRRQFPESAFAFATEHGGIGARVGHDTRRIQDWLGHRSIQHTTRYTQLSAAPFLEVGRLEKLGVKRSANRCGYRL